MKGFEGGSRNLTSAALCTVVVFVGLMCEVGEATHKCRNDDSGARIVGGRNVTDMRERPYVVQIIERMKGPYCWGPGDCEDAEFWYKFSCTGTLVSRYTVITARHCIGKNSTVQDWAVLAGVAQLHGYGPYTTDPQFIFASQIFRSRRAEYKKGGDIALLFFKNPFNITDYVRPIKLLGYSRAEFLKKHAELLRDKASCIVSGWGTTQKQYYNDTLKEYVGKTTVVSEILNTINMDLWLEPDCRYESRFAFWYGVRNYTICIASPTGDEGFCDGDSGAGLICNDRLVAVVAWSEECGTALPQHCASIMLVVEWMEDIMCVPPYDCEKIFYGYESPRARTASAATVGKTTSNPGALSTAPIITPEGISITKMSVIVAFIQLHICLS